MIINNHFNNISRVQERLENRIIESDHSQGNFYSPNRKNFYQIYSIITTSVVI